MIKGIHHIGVATRDLDRLCDFYCDYFHGRRLAEFSWDQDNKALSERLGLASSAGRLCMLGFAETRLEVFEFKEPVILPENSRSVAAPGLSHIAFEVDDALAEFERLSSVINFHAPPLTMPAGGVFAYGRDPDGNVVEILQTPKQIT